MCEGRVMTICIHCHRNLPLPPLARSGERWPVSHYCTGFANPSGARTDEGVRDYLFKWLLEPELSSAR